MQDSWWITSDRRFFSGCFDFELTLHVKLINVSWILGLVYNLRFKEKLFVCVWYHVQVVAFGVRLLWKQAIHKWQPARPQCLSRVICPWPWMAVC